MNKKSLIYLLFFIAMAMIIFLGIVIFKDINGLQTYETKQLSFKYNKSWVPSGDKNKIILEHKTGSVIKMETMTIAKEDRLINASTLLKQIKEDILKNNSTYHLIMEKDKVESKYHYNGQTILLEDADKQILITFILEAGQLNMITYEASHQYFDILLDSARAIIYEFEVKI